MFLDESKPNTNFPNFTLGGVIIEKNIYETKVRPAVDAIKKACFSDTGVILHEIDIRRKKGSFNGITKQQQEKFFLMLNNLFITNDFLSVMAVSINIADINKLYAEDDRNDIYYVALQLLMENFAHFLSGNDGIGTIYLETTDPVNNQRLQNLFYVLKATGTLFVKKEALQTRLSTINFGIKSENIIGLQLADFIPNSLARKALGIDQKPNSVIDGIEKRLYDGNVNMKERFGFKIIK